MATSNLGRTETNFITITNANHPFKLRQGGILPEVTLAYEMYGTLNPQKDNAILVFHALTGSQHAAGFNSSIPGVGERWSEECHIGWWEDFIGPEKAIDTNKYCAICINYLGGCYGSTGPLSLNPLTGKPYGGSFPWITLADIVDSQMLLLDRLGIEKLHATIGGSLGGLMTLSLATRFPDRVKIVIPIATGVKTTMLQRIHNFEQICAIEFDPAFHGGDYYGTSGPAKGLALARMVGHKTFVSLDTMEQRARTEFLGNEHFGQYQLTHSIESYMLHQGTKFVTRFDANTYLCLMGVWQTVDLLGDAKQDNFQDLFSVCRNQNFMVFSIDSDVCFFPEEQMAMVQELKHAKVATRYLTIHSDNGHDSFLLEPELFSPYISHALEDGWW